MTKTKNNPKKLPVIGSKLDTPAYTTISPINIKGEEGERLMTVYKTKGCEYDSKRKGCTMCDFASYADPDITEDNIRRQHRQSLETLSNADFIHFDLLTLGNFYNDREISPELRRDLLRPLATIRGVKRVLTESRRAYVTVDKLVEAKSCLRDDQTLEYALGYESFTPELRNGVLRKGVQEEHLDESLQICKKAGVDFVAYVLIKPQTLNEREGIEDAVNTAVHVLKKADSYGVNARVAFEPVFVTKGKEIENLWKKGEYVPPKLWSVAQVLIETANRLGMRNTRGKLFVGLSDENLSDQRMASNCGKCDSYVKRAIQDFNGNQDVPRLESLSCECKYDWQQEIRGDGECLSL